MAKARSGAKSKPDPTKRAKTPSRGGLLEGASRKLIKAAGKLVDAVTATATKGKAKVSAPAVKAAKAAPPEAPPAKPVAAKPSAKAAKAEREEKPASAEKAPKAEKAQKSGKAEKATKAGRPGKDEDAGARPRPNAVMALIPPPDKPKPRASKLPPMSEPLTKREMEQLLTVGQGRGVMGEGSLKGRLIVKEGFPYLQVIGRDKRELVFLLQGPDQEVLPAYGDHKVSVSGLVKKTHNYGGSVDVRKYSAKSPETEAAAAPPEEARIRYLSPGEIAQISNAGMGAGMKGFGNIRGSLEMTGEEYVLVVSNSGTRHQVSFILAGKGAKGLKRFLGQTLQVTGVIDKTTGWGGRIDVEAFEPRATEIRMSRDNLEVQTIDEKTTSVEVKLNHGLSIRLAEKVGSTWAIEPTTAKRVGLREANFEPESSGPGTREFFFTPRNPGAFEVEFFLAKALTPGQVSRTFKLNVNVKP